MYHVVVLPFRYRNAAGTYSKLSYSDHPLNLVIGLILNNDRFLFHVFCLQSRRIILLVTGIHWRKIIRLSSQIRRTTQTEAMVMTPERDCLSIVFTIQVQLQLPLLVRLTLLTLRLRPSTRWGRMICSSLRTAQLPTMILLLWSVSVDSSCSVTLFVLFAARREHCHWNQR